MTFAEEHADRILSGQKKLTLRVGEVDVEVGDRFEMVTAGGERIASAVVSRRGYTTADMAVRMHFDAHRNYDTVNELLNELAEYYPDEDLHDQTTLEIVRWTWRSLRQ